MSPTELLLLQISTPILIFLALLEFITGVLHNNPKYSRKETFINIWTSLLRVPLDLLFRGIGLGVFAWLYQFHFIMIENRLLYWVVLILLGDFCFWLMHWVSHQVRLFWATHAIHHSSTEMNLSIGLRADYWQSITKFFYYSPLILLGFQGEDVLVAYLITLIYGTAVHTEHFPVGRLQWMEWIFITPSLHRVHHASNLKYLDKNMGMIFSIWDHIFGTYQAEDANEKVIYGLVGQKESSTPFDVVTHEFVDIKNDLKHRNLSFVQKMKYLFAPPGWSHDGSKQTVREMRKASYSSRESMMMN